MISCYIEGCADGAVLDLAGRKICRKHYNRLCGRVDDHELLPDVNHMLLKDRIGLVCHVKGCDVTGEGCKDDGSWICAYHYRLERGDSPKEARRRSDVYHAEKVAAQNTERGRKMDTQTERIAREASESYIERFLSPAEETTITQLAERIDDLAARVATVMANQERIVQQQDRILNLIEVQAGNR